ncbi:MAG: hypothetical protein ABIO72_06095 [Patescibacteria group bacterium]
MELSQFLRRFLYHITAASCVLFVVLAVGEYLVPGVVLPFVDLVDVAPFLLVLLGLSILSSP